MGMRKDEGFAALGQCLHLCTNVRQHSRANVNVVLLCSRAYSNAVIWRGWHRRLSVSDVHSSLRQRRAAFIHRVILPYDTWCEENEQLVTIILLAFFAEEPAKDGYVRQARNARSARLDGPPVQATDYYRIAILD